MVDWRTSRLLLLMLGLMSAVLVVVAFFQFDVLGRVQDIALDDLRPSVLLARLGVGQDEAAPAQESGEGKVLGAVTEEQSVFAQFPVQEVPAGAQAAFGPLAVTDDEGQSSASSTGGFNLGFGSLASAGSLSGNSLAVSTGSVDLQVSPSLNTATSAAQTTAAGSESGATTAGLVITAVEPASARAGERIAISGRGFGSYLEMTLAGPTTLTVGATSMEGTRALMLLPRDIVAGRYTITAVTRNLTSNSVAFTVTNN